MWGAGGQGGGAEAGEGLRAQIVNNGSLVYLVQTLSCRCFLLCVVHHATRERTRRKSKYASSHADQRFTVIPCIWWGFFFKIKEKLSCRL